MEEKTDLENFIELYKSVGIELKVKDSEESKSIEILSRDCEKIVGYPGFGTEITFDKNGKFLKQGFYEW